MAISASTSTQQLGQGRRLLIVDDHASIRELLASWARGRGFQTKLAADGQQALAELEQHEFDLVLSDVRMPGLSGPELLQQLESRGRSDAVVFITAFGNVQEAVQVLHAGALDYVTKPFNVAELFARIEERLQQVRRGRAAAHLQTTPGRPREGAEVVAAPGEVLRSTPRSAATASLATASAVDVPAPLLVGAPGNLQRLYDLLDQVAPARCTVFINGPSGVGKELVSTELHQRSNRRQRPFIRVNCPAIPRELQESELFGHEKGAFTGATRRREGKFFYANGGTILLDEISETSLAFQSKLLRVLQEREYERVGGNETIHLDVRLIATSNRDMGEMVVKGKFREDLFYRLNVVPIDIRPLCERREDIPYLVEHFVRRFCEENQRLPMQVSPEAMEQLVCRQWQGNVRQLQNVCERAVVLKRHGCLLEPRDFLLDLEIDSRSRSDAVAEPTIAGMERDLILKTLRATRANRTEAARQLGISVRTLRNKLNEYRALGIDVDAVLDAAAR